MLKIFLYAVIPVLIGFRHLPAEATGADVVPINWARFSGPAPSDSLALKAKKLLQNSVKYFLNSYVDSLPTNDSGLFRLTAYIDLEHMGIREPSTGAGMVSIALATGSYDPSLIGRTEAEARGLQVKLIKSLTALHSSSGGSYWGGCWQCALWAAYTGFAAWLVWPDLDSAARTQAARLVESEANRFNADPPYCNDCTDDTKAEENAWDAMVITVAVAMLPNHPNVNWWKSRASQWMLSAYARESDLHANRLVDGKLPRHWLTGWNAREPGYVYNHGIMHPDYMCAIQMNLYALLFQSLAAQVVPQAGVYSFDAVYRCLVDYLFTVPPWNAPGGTIYRPGKAKIYYPNGTDWSIYSIDRFFELDVFSFILPGIGDQVSTPASAWAAIRADTLAWRQSRFSTGQQYAPGEWDRFTQAPWKLAEFFGGWMFGTSYLSLWLQAQNGFMPVGNWNLATPDTVPPPAPAALAADALSMSAAGLNWSRVADIGSGTAYYLVYRDSVEIGITQDTFFLNSGLRENTPYRYSVSVLDWNNNEGPRSSEALVLTFQDTASLLLRPDSLALKLNDSAALQLRYLHSDGTQTPCSLAVLWTSLSPDVVETDNAGRIHSFGKTGEALILCSSVSSGFSDTVRVKVLPLETFSLSPVEDTYVHDANPAVNYGNDTVLLVKNPTRQSYLKFDMSGLAGKKVVGAVLKTYLMTSFLPWPSYPTLTLTAWGVSSSAWSEGAMTWNNRPPMSTPLDTAVLCTAAVDSPWFAWRDSLWYVWDVVSWIAGHAQDSLISLAVNGTRVADLCEVFASSENMHAAFRPRLEIVAEESLTAALSGPLIENREFSLSALPNPFNASVLIRASGLRSGATAAAAYDIRGHQAADFKITKEGAVWNAGNLPGGLYFIRAKDGNGKQLTIKAVLLK